MTRQTPFHDLIGRLEGDAPAELRLERRALRGGLEAAGIERVAARYTDRRGRARVVGVVVKRLVGPALREADVYERFVAPYAGALSPDLLALERVDAERAVLYLEALRPVRSWPWRDLTAATSVLASAARLHAAAPSPEAGAVLAAWDYEGELAQVASHTIERLEQVAARPEYARFGRALGWARRLAADLPRLRRQLVTGGPLDRAVIHGDLHPGNVVLRRRNGDTQPVLVDWGRARLGSPLEDVSCWVHSLGTWEPEARRRHDTLLCAYLAARGREARLTRELRDAHWLAGASNAFSGALLYHCCVLLDETVPSSSRAKSAHAASEWVRVLRGAATVCA